ncbi:hypothetical protein IFM46972_01663 [Aspergillus udagawae]|uniref:Uncharacterized protein n=1 Tax=Aspergillus udagawae TaxID=91492 RepID=A0A8H3RHF8_9EURO|nr:hypothetical protein IFM46972_01663 [Aspergillus udagawae]
MTARDLPQIDGDAFAVVKLALQFQLSNHIGRRGDCDAGALDADRGSVAVRRGACRGFLGAGGDLRMRRKILVLDPEVEDDVSPPARKAGRTRPWAYWKP